MFLNFLKKLRLFKKKRFIYFWLRWVLAAVHSGFVLLWQVGPILFIAASRLPTEVSALVVEHGLNGLAACDIFLDQGSNPCPLHWQADS